MCVTVFRLPLSLSGKFFTPCSCRMQISAANAPNTGDVVAAVVVVATTSGSPSPPAKQQHTPPSLCVSVFSTRTWGQFEGVSYEMQILSLSAARFISLSLSPPPSGHKLCSLGVLNSVNPGFPHLCSVQHHPQLHVNLTPLPPENKPSRVLEKGEGGGKGVRFLVLNLQNFNRSLAMTFC